MQLSDWDEQFGDTEQHLQALEHSDQITQIYGQRVIDQKQDAVLQFQAANEQMVDKFKGLHARNLKIGNKPKSIIYWGLVLAQKSLSLYRKKSEFMGKRYWLQLTQHRLSLEPGQASSLLDDTALMEMATREMRLKNREKQLQQELNRISKLKTTFKARHEKLQTQASNHQAAASLQKEWIDGDGQRDEAYNALNSFVKNVSMATRSTSPKERTYQLMQQKLVKETDQVIENCREILAQDISPQKLNVAEPTLSSLEHSIEDLNSLRDQIQELKSQISDDETPDMHPIMVKNSQKGVKKRVLNKRPSIRP